MTLLFHLLVQPSLTLASHYDPHQHTGVAFLLAEKWRACLRRELRCSNSDGRILGVHLESRSAHLVLITVYMPSGLDRASLSSPDAACAERLYQIAIQWADSISDNATVIVLGDMNETITVADRNRVTQGSHSNRFISRLSDVGFVDAYTSLHSVDKRAWTCRTGLGRGAVALSRIDYIFVRASRAACLASTKASTSLPLTAVVHHKPKNVSSRHLPIVATLRTSISAPRSLPPPPPTTHNLRTAAKEKLCYTGGAMAAC